jgi:hypothetical protein
VPNRVAQSIVNTRRWRDDFCEHQNLFHSGARFRPPRVCVLIQSIDGPVCVRAHKRATVMEKSLRLKCVDHGGWGAGATLAAAAAAADIH